MFKNKTIKVGKKVLKAYVLAKQGLTKKSGEILAEIMIDEAIDPFMDGIAKTIEDLQVDNTEDIAPIEEEVEADNEVQGEMEDIVEDEEVEMEMNEDEEEDEEEVEDIQVPASVAKVLKISY